MRLDRRRLLAAAAALAASGAGRRARREDPLEGLLAAHAGVLPERPGAGANHYPMAAEALVALGHGDAIETAWVEGAALYAGELPRAAPLRTEAERAEALGRYERYGDWLDVFRGALDGAPWRDVVRAWTPRLAPGLIAGAYHGLIRTGHAVRALRDRDTPARRGELAVGLAYWAARFEELPTKEGAPPEIDLAHTLAALEHPWRDDRSDVGFFDVTARLRERPVLPPVDLAASGLEPRDELDLVVREAAAGFLEMLVLERHRLWLLHTVTGPAAVEWLLPDVNDPTARALVRHARRSVVAMYHAYGEPFARRAHLREELSPWPALVRRAADSRSVHGIKLIDALVRFDRGGDPLWRSVAEQWFEWT